MPSVSRTFSVRPVPARVLSYLADFSNAEEWDPGTQSCVRIDSGPVKPGATWKNTSRIFGMTAELTYTLKELTADRVVFVGTNKGSTSTDDIRVDPDGTGSKLTYRANLEMHGLAKLASPLMKVVFEKLAGDVKRQMTEVLNHLD